MPTILLILSLAVSTLVTATSVDRFHGLYQQTRVERVVTEVARAAERQSPECFDSSVSAPSLDDLVRGEWLKPAHRDLATDLLGAELRIVMRGGSQQEQIELHTPGKNLGWLAARTNGELGLAGDQVQISTRRQAGTLATITPGIDHARLFITGEEGNVCTP